MPQIKRIKMISKNNLFNPFNLWQKINIHPNSSNTIFVDMLDVDALQCVSTIQMHKKLMPQIKGFKKINPFNHFNLWQKKSSHLKNLQHKIPLEIKVSHFIFT